MTDETLYIVDGYNVLHALFRGASKEEIFARRDWLADKLAGFAALRGAQAVLVFDGHGPQSTSASRSRARPSRCASPAAVHRRHAHRAPHRRAAGRLTRGRRLGRPGGPAHGRPRRRSRMTPLELAAELTPAEPINHLILPAKPVQCPHGLRIK